MAVLIQPMHEREVVKIKTISAMKKNYNALADQQRKIIHCDLLLCPKCGEWRPAESSFYLDKTFYTDRFPVCRNCLKMMAEQRDNRNDTPNETKESVQFVLRFMNKIWDNDYYDACVKSVMDDTGEKQKASAFQMYITGIQSLPQFRGKTWKDSRFGDDIIDQDSDEVNENSRIVKAAKKRFGKDYSTNDLYFLESQYEDWVSRYECNTKAQEEIFERLAFKKWEINKATKAGEPTATLDKTYQDLLNTANITPRQTGMDAFADAQTLGTLIQKWEETRPLPEIDPELQDVDKIGLYIDAFFRGHTSKMLGLKNKFSNIYEKVMSKYTVKPPSYEDEEESEAVFNQIFGSSEDF